MGFAYYMMQSDLLTEPEIKKLVYHLIKFNNF